MIVGSSAKETAGMQELLQPIESKCEYQLPMVVVSDGRRTEADPQ
jgi:hypothetical protein